MAANTSPIFTITPNAIGARPTSANTATDGSGTITTVFTAGANGSRVDRVTVTSAQSSLQANSAMIVCLYISDTSGTNFRLYRQSALTAVIQSTTAIGATTTFNFIGGLILKSGQLLGCSQTVYVSAAKDTMDFIAEGGDF